MHAIPQNANTQTFSSGAPRQLPALAQNLGAASALNEVVIPHKQELAVINKGVSEFNVSGVAVGSMRESSLAHALSGTVPIAVRKVNLSEEAVKARENWAKALSAVRQLVKGAFKDCLVITESYYLEMLDPRHEYAVAHDDNIEDWQAHPQKGHLPYFQFLEAHRRPIVYGTEVRNGILRVPDPFSYVTTENRRYVLDRPRLEKSWVYTGSNEGVYLASGVDQFTAQESAKQFEILIQDQQVSFSPDFRPAWRDKIENSGRLSELIFVSDKEGAMYAGFKEKGMFHHSSFLSGAPVAMAGTLVVNPAGQLIGVSNLSGHYQPKEVQSVQFLRQLASTGVDLSKLRFVFAKEKDGEIQKEFTGRASVWLEQYQHSGF